ELGAGLQPGAIVDMDHDAGLVVEIAIVRGELGEGGEIAPDLAGIEVAVAVFEAVEGAVPVVGLLAGADDQHVAAPLPERRLVPPARLPRRHQRRASIASQTRAAMSTPPKRFTSRMPVGEVTLISVR